MANATPMLDTVKGALNEWDMTYKEVPSSQGVQIIEFGMSGQYTNYRSILSIDPDDSIFGCYYLMPMKIVESRRGDVAQYLAAVNYKVMLGHFDLDMRDGEVRFKVSTITKGSELSREMVKQMVGVSMRTMDRYFPGIMAVEFGKVPPLEALQNVEQAIAAEQPTQAQSQ